VSQICWRIGLVNYQKWCLSTAAVDGLVNWSGERELKEQLYIDNSTKKHAKVYAGSMNSDRAGIFFLENRTTFGLYRNTQPQIQL
jgi:hypothetical protein